MPSNGSGNEALAYNVKGRGRGKELKEGVAIQVSTHRLACPFVQSQLV